MLQTKKCLVPECSSDRKAILHNFPKRPWSAEKWRAVVNSPLLTLVKTENLSKYSICYRHFEEADYSTTSKIRRLNANAVPSRNLPSNPESEKALEEEILQSSSRELPPEPPTHPDPIQTQTQIPWPSNPASEKALEEEVSQSSSRKLPSESPTHPDPIHTSTQNSSDHSAFIDNEQLATPEATVSTVSKSPKYMRQTSITTQRELRRLRQLPKKQALLRQQIKRLKNRLKTMKEREKKHFKNWDKLTPVQKIFIDMHLSNADIKPEGRRYTNEQRILGAVMCKWSPSVYRRLSSYFTLPGATTVHNLLRKITCHTGINTPIFKRLKEHTARMEEKDRYCVINWDEMKLMSHLEYNQLSDQIVGFEDWQHRRTSKFADHVIVFMIRGIATGWKLPIYYGFCDGQTNAPDLTRCLKTVVKALENVGLHPLATVCDQSSTNCTVIRKLVQYSNGERWRNGEKSRDVIKISNTELIPLFDGPHLIKGLRNNLLTKHIEMDVDEKKKTERKFASWSIIKQAYEIDQNSGKLRLQLPKITEEHIYVERMKKMRVKPAVHVLSRTVGKLLDVLANSPGRFCNFIIKKPHKFFKINNIDIRDNF